MANKLRALEAQLTAAQIAQLQPPPPKGKPPKGSKASLNTSLVIVSAKVGVGEERKAHAVHTKHDALSTQGIVPPKPPVWPPPAPIADGPKLSETELSLSVALLGQDRWVQEQLRREIESERVAVESKLEEAELEHEAARRAHLASLPPPPEVAAIEASPAQLQIEAVAAEEQGGEIEQYDTISSKALSVQEYSAEHLEDYLSDLFRVGDENGDGVLQPAELRRLLQMSGFRIPEDKVEEVMAKADVNSDGVIDYPEFVALATKMIRGEKQEEDATSEGPASQTASGHEEEPTPENHERRRAKKLAALLSEQEAALGLSGEVSVSVKGSPSVGARAPATPRSPYTPRKAQQPSSVGSPHGSRGMHTLASQNQRTPRMQVASLQVSELDGPPLSAGKQALLLRERQRGRASGNKDPQLYQQSIGQGESKAIRGKATPRQRK